MSEDFETGLRDLYAQAAAAHAGGDGFPTTAMAGQVRRNRRVRALGVSVVTVAVVAGVAIGGAAVVRLNDAAPVPPAETSRPDETVEPPEITWPTATVLTCGAVIADLPTFEDAPATIEASIETPTLPVSDALAATVVIAATDSPGPTIMSEVVLGMRYLVVQDGVVVGIGRDNGEAPVVPLSGRDGIAHEAEISVAGCDEEGLTTTQLAAGDYALYAGLVAQVSGRPDDGGPGDEGVLLGGPWPFTLIEDTPSADPETPQPPDELGVDGASAAFTEGEPLADGDYFGLLQGIDAANGTIDVDLARFFGGQAAEDYIAANVPDAEPLDEYYIANDLETVTTLPVAADAPVWDWCFEPTEQSPLGYYLRTIDEWATAPVFADQDVPAYQCSDGANVLRGDLYWLRVRDGLVVEVAGQYVP
jgi:hypothetical protein